MRVFVTGVAGQLGHDVMNELALRGHEGIGSDLAPAYAGIQDGSPVTSAAYVSLDITDREAVRRTLTELHPDMVVHCAAWTAVDLAEDADKIDKVRSINAGGTENIALASKECDAGMVYLSTDYVFDGQGSTPWDPDFKGYSPLNVYGQTKLEGELAVSRILEKYYIVRIVCDQIGTPTYTFDLARLLVDMIETDRYGYYHATNAELPAGQGEYTQEGTKTGYISWYDFSKEIFRQAAALGHPEYEEQNLKLVPVTTEEYGLSKAKRPYNSRLDKAKLEKNGFRPLPDWQDALRRYLKEIEI